MYKDNTLIISAIRNEEKDNYIRRERSYGQISRVFHVENVDREKISAKFKNGELQITLPKLVQTISQSSKIPIE
ncbi:MAG: Hsp20 family protein [Clostridium sp.]|nr:Hsp20 family protein [Clostridium sp.]